MTTPFEATPDCVYDLGILFERYAEQSIGDQNISDGNFTGFGQNIITSYLGYFFYNISIRKPLEKIRPVPTIHSRPRAKTNSFTWNFWTACNIQICVSDTRLRSHGTV